MKKLLLSSILLITSMSMADQIDDFKAQLTSSQELLKSLQAEIDVYNQSSKPMNDAKKAVADSNSIITNLTNKLEPLTGIVMTNGNITYNNNSSSNKVLGDANIKLQQEIDDLTSQNKALDQNIDTARGTLGNLRGKPVTADISSHIKFYQDKIAAYQKTQNDNNNTIQKDRTMLSSNNSTIALNTTQINTYQAQIDAAKKTIIDNQKIVDDWTAKLNATPDKVNFSNITMINNKVNDTQSQIDYLNSQIASLQAKSDTEKK